MAQLRVRSGLLPSVPGRRQRDLEGKIYVVVHALFVGQTADSGRTYFLLNYATLALEPLAFHLVSGRGARRGWAGRHAAALGAHSTPINRNGNEEREL